METATYTPTCGENIRHACQKAIEMAHARNAVVAFKFNDVQMTARPGDNETLLEGIFHHQCEARAKQYRESPEGSSAARQREADIRLKQHKIEMLIPLLEGAITDGLDSVVSWLREYAKIADDVDVDGHLRTVLNALIRVGYVDNEFTGTAWVEGDKRIMGRWIVGQCINCMLMGMPPHPVSIHFAEQYAEMLD